jgi:hypothetical protein
MKQCLHYLKTFTVVLVLVMAASAVNAQTRTASASGNWNNTATWGGASVPTSANDVVINNGVTVTVNVPAACASITIGNTDATGGINISGTNSLAVTNSIIIGDLLDNTSGITIAVGAGTFSCASITMADVTLSNDDISLTVSTGTATISGDIVMNGIAGENLVNVTGTGTLNIGGAISATNGALTGANASTINYNGADQNVKAATYGNLNLSGTGTKTQGGAITINTNLTVAAGVTLDVTGFNFSVGAITSVSGTLTHSSATGTKTYTGNVIINNGGIWNDDAAIIPVGFGGNLQNDGTMNAGTGAHTFSNNTKTFSGTNAILISNITISGSRTNNGILSASTLTVNAAMTNSGTITTSTALAGTNTLTQGAGSTLNIGGTSAINVLNASVNSNIVNYTGSGQTVKTATYYHLVLSGSGTATAGNSLDINGNITIGNGVTFDGGTFAHSLAGNWINNGGTLTSTGSGSITFDGTTQSIGGTGTTTFNSLQLNGAPTTTTLAIDISIAGNLTLSTGDVFDLSTFLANRTAVGGTLSLTTTSILKLSGTSGGATGSNFPINFTTNTLSGTVNYNSAAGGQTIYSTPTYTTLTLGNTSGTQTAGGNLTVTTLNNNTNAADILDMGANTLTVTTVNNTATIKTQNTSATPLSTGRTWGGTVEYNGASQTVVTAASYNHLVISGSGTKTSAAALDINGNLTIESGTTLNGSTFSHTIAGNWISNGGTYTSTGTVTFDGTTQSISGSASTAFNNLTVNGPSTTTLAINISVAGNVSITSGDVLDLSTFTCNRTVAGGTLSVAGTLKLGGTSGGQTGSNYPLNFTTNTLGGTVNYNNATGGQKIFPASYTILTLGNTNGTQTAGGNLTVTTLNNNTSAADVLDMVTNALTVTNVNNIGTIKTQNISATPLSNGRTWGGTVEYDGASQTIVAGTYTNLVTSNSGTKSLAAATTASGNTTIGAGTKVDVGVFTMTLGTASVVTVNGTLDFSNSTGLIRTAATGASTLTMGASGLIRTFDDLGLGPVTNASLQTQGTGTWATTSISTNGTVEYYRNATSAQAITDRDYNNLIISGNTQLKTWTMAAARTVNGSVTISADAPFTLAGAQTLNVKGDWTKNSVGAFTPGTGTINFNGSTLQTIGGTVSTAFGAVTFNNAAGFSLAKDATVNGLMTFTNGVVNASSNLLTISVTGSVSGASDASFVDGKVKRTGIIGVGGFDFPVGKTGVGYMKIGAANVTDAAAEFTAQYFRASAMFTFDTMGLGSLSLQAVSNCEYWTLDRASTTSSADVTLYWNAHSPCGNGPYLVDPLFGVRVVHYNTSTLQWDAHGGGTPSGDASAGSVTWTGVSNFSPFALGAAMGSQNGLPVMFNNVKAYEKNDGVQIEWTNLTERDLLNYIVERSANGVNFTSIGQQLPRSNSNDKESYSAFDAAPFTGVNFYRIKVLEISGKIIYSKVIRVEIAKAVRGFALYPNPVKGNHVSLSLTNRQGQYTMKVFNTAGQEIYSQKIVHHGGSMTQTVELPSTIKPGVYNMLISGDNYREAKMFVVQ